MKKIKKLPKKIIAQFLTFNCKNRSAFILKELLENSCDANSTKITVYINNNTTDTSIKIIDNGDGITKNNLNRIGSKNKTSKIKKIKDLKNIELYGFKGESLYIIKNLYNIEIISKARDKKITYKLNLEKRLRQISIEKITDNTGTTIIIKNIKILHGKKYLNNLYHIFKCTVLPNPHIHFILFKNSIECFNIPACKNIEDDKLRVKNILKTKCLKNSVDVNYIYNDLNFTGFITFSKKIKKNFLFTYFFINNRIVKCKILEDIITDIIHTLKINISIGFYLNLKTELNLFKFKLTPEKNEIIFKNNKMFYNIFTHIIKSHIYEYKKFFNININTTNNSKINNIINYKFIDNSIISNIKPYNQKNKIISIINNDIIILTFNNNIYNVKIHKVREKLIIKTSIDQFIKTNNIKDTNVNNTECYTIKKKYYIIKYNEFFKMYGFRLQILDDDKIIIKSIPDMLKHLLINWENLINMMIDYFSKSLSLYFSKNRFDINIIKIFIDNIYPQSVCFNFELKILYKEIIYIKKNEKNWFKQHCKKIYSKKGK